MFNQYTMHSCAVSQPAVLSRSLPQPDHPNHVLTLVLQAEMRSLRDLTKLYFFPHFTSKQRGGKKVCKISRITLVLALISVLLPFSVKHARSDISRMSHGDSYQRICMFSQSQAAGTLCCTSISCTLLHFLLALDRSAHAFLGACNSLVPTVWNTTFLQAECWLYRIKKKATCHWKRRRKVRIHLLFRIWSCQWPGKEPSR